MSLCTCLKATAREDGRDGDGNYKLVFKITHTGHQSYGQSFTVEFANDFSIAEVPGDVTAEVVGKELRLQRNNQLNDNGLTEIWVKLRAGEQPRVEKIFELDCRQEEEKNAGESV